MKKGSAAERIALLRNAVRAGPEAYGAAVTSAADAKRKRRHFKQHRRPEPVAEDPASTASLGDDRPPRPLRDDYYDWSSGTSSGSDGDDREDALFLFDGGWFARTEDDAPGPIAAVGYSVAAILRIAVPVFATNAVMLAAQLGMVWLAVHVLFAPHSATAPAPAATVRQHVVRGAHGHALAHATVQPTVAPALMAEAFTAGWGVAIALAVVLGGGLASALDTLAPQSVGRCDGGRTIGALLLRGIALSSVPVAAALVGLWLQGPLVIGFLFGLEPHAAELAAASLRALTPNVALLLLHACLCKTLQGIRAPGVATRGALIGTLITAALLPAAYSATPVVLRVSFGFAAICAAAHTALVLAATWAVAGRDHRVGFISRGYGLRWAHGRVLCDAPVREFLRQGTPSLLAAASEWGAGLIFAAVVVGRESSARIAAFAANTQLSAALATTSLAWGAGTSVAVGIALGQRDPHGARRAAFVSLVIGTLIGIGLAALVLFGVPVTAPVVAEYVAGVHAHTAAARHAIEALDALRPGLAMVALGNAVQDATQGVYNGGGEQYAMGAITLLGVWGITVPVAVALVALHHWGVAGVYAGLAIGLGLELLTLVHALGRWNWAFLSVKAARRTAATRISFAALAKATQLLHTPAPEVLQSIDVPRDAPEIVAGPHAVADTQMAETPPVRSPTLDRRSAARESAKTPKEKLAAKRRGKSNEGPQNSDTKPEAKPEPEPETKPEAAEEAKPAAIEVTAPEPTTTTTAAPLSREESVEQERQFLAARVPVAQRSAAPASGRRASGSVSRLAVARAARTGSVSDTPPSGADTPPAATAAASVAADAAKAAAAFEARLARFRSDDFQ